MQKRTAMAPAEGHHGELSAIQAGISAHDLKHRLCWHLVSACDSPCHIRERIAWNCAQDVRQFTQDAVGCALVVCHDQTPSLRSTSAPADVTIMVLKGCL